MEIFIKHFQCVMVKKSPSAALITLTVLSKDQLSKFAGTVEKSVIYDACPSIDAEPCRLIFRFIS